MRALNLVRAQARAGEVLEKQQLPDTMLMVALVFGCNRFFLPLQHLKQRGNGFFPLGHEANYERN